MVLNPTRISPPLFLCVVAHSQLVFVHLAAFVLYVVLANSENKGHAQQQQQKRD